MVLAGTMWMCRTGPNSPKFCGAAASIQGLYQHVLELDRVSAQLNNEKLVAVSMQELHYEGVQVFAATWLHSMSRSWHLAVLLEKHHAVPTFNMPIMTHNVCLILVMLAA